MATLNFKEPPSSGFREWGFIIWRRKGENPAGTQITMKLVSATTIKWFLDLNVAEKTKLPFNKVNSKSIDCSFEGMKYLFKAGKGSFSKPATGLYLE